MLVKQISVFLENKPGRLAEVTKTLSQNKIDIRALYIADTTEYGILRMIVDQPDKGVELLKKAGFTVNTTNVIAIALEDTPGKLDGALNALSSGDISVEYLYAFVGRASTDAIVIIRVEDTTSALKVLNDKKIKTLDPKEVYGLWTFL